MAKGTAKWFGSIKGYGFIQPDEGGKDVLVHYSAVERAGLRDLPEGQKISLRSADCRASSANDGRSKGDWNGIQRTECRPARSVDPVLPIFAQQRPG